MNLYPEADCDGLFGEGAGSVDQRAWLVDASIYVFKAWFTWPEDLCDRNGEPVHATLGFIEFVRRLLQEQQPASLAFAFDQSLSQCWRSALYPAYKANREPAPDNLKHQFRLCREFLRAVGLAEYASSRFEADDLIGSLAARERAAGRQVVLVTGDKDLLQLLQPGDVWWELVRNKQIPYQGVFDALGVRAYQVADFLALAGDKVDNIPGVPGVGAATAAKLLKRFGNLDILLAQSERIGDSRMRGAKRIQQLIEAHRDQLLLYRQLTRIRCDLADELTVTAPEVSLESLCELLQLNDRQAGFWQQVASARGPAL